MISLFIAIPRPIFAPAATVARGHGNPWGRPPTTLHHLFGRSKFAVDVGSWEADLWGPCNTGMAASGPTIRLKEGNVFAGLGFPNPECELRQDVQIAVRPARQEHGGVSLVLARSGAGLRRSTRPSV
jgi:hypothetical protein